MRAVVQRVSRATLTVDGVVRAEVPAASTDEAGGGLVVLVGIEQSDTEADRGWMAQKIAHLRVFPDEQGKMNRSVVETGGRILLVPNFTVAGDARKGRRPSFDNAMKPPEASVAFDALAEALRFEAGRPESVVTGVFGAHMHVELVNDGPVTIWLDSRAG